MKKYTYKEFLEKTNSLFGNKYIYSYEGFEKRLTTGKIEYMCPKHGLVTQRLSVHLKGCGCNKCGNEEIGKKVSSTFEDFIKRAREIHGDKYIYDEDSYSKNTSPVKIFCKIHNFWFEQLPCNHFKGCGCPKCGGNYRISSEEYVESLKKKYPLSNISFEKVKYVNNHKPINLVCPVHGDFEITPITIEKNLECPECQKIRLHDKYAKTTEEFINQAKKIHGDKFIYSKTVYKTCKDKLTITCPSHGDFETLPITHLKGHGCPFCANEHLWDNRERLDTETYIKKAIEKHNGKYIYLKTNYTTAHNKVIITCPIHGDFEQDAYAHLNGQGCPICNRELTESIGEKQVRDFIRGICSSKVYSNSRKLLYPLELDVYIPSIKTAFEFDGLYWHSDAKIDSNYHLNKTNDCIKKGFNLYHIFSDEWEEKHEIVKSKIKSILGKTDKKIYARKCTIKEIDSKTLKDFLVSNHLQGNVNSSYRYGLFYNNELVSVMSFGLLRKSLGSKNDGKTYEMLRFCNKLNTSVVGGASKLLKHFIKEVSPKRIISYADRRWSTGDLYMKLGFVHIRDSKPNYYYLVNHNSRRENRFKYRKDILVKQGFDPNKSEKQIMQERGIHRIYDCGSMVFEMNL